MSQMGSTSPARTSRTATAGLGLALVAAALMLGGYVSVSTAGLNIEIGFMLFLAGVALGFIALAVSVVGLWRTRMASGRNRAWAGIIVSGLIIVPMAPQIMAAFSVPPIHDITTDTENPPKFVDILPLRADAPNTADYGGETVAELQKTAYPGIKPMILSAPPSEAFAKAQKIIDARGWTVAGEDADAGRIEATAVTKNMRFKDDVVIRITPEGDGSRIDMRSVSRFGQSDLGVNAKRITEFLKDMEASQIPPS
ncbi:MAG: DUF1499 domain-containing protein [Alphaproteobacteria bacterium]|nr:DUF1499 domain-containing protein [Alphaproteobacteria bacterium]